MAKKNKTITLEAQVRKCHPRLRMITNGSTTVNAVRAEQCASIKVENRTILGEIPLLRGEEACRSKRRTFPAV